MGALRALAASHIRGASAALAGIRQYTEIIEDAIADAACLGIKNGNESVTGSPPGNVLLVVCSEHGFVGAFNERLLDRAMEELKAGQQLAIIGARGATLAPERGLTPAWKAPMATRADSVLTITRPIVDRMAGITNTNIVYARYQPGGSYEITFEQLMPLNPSLHAMREPRNPPLHQLPPDTLLLRLVGEHLFAEITRAVTESLASENAARLRIMENADQNIGDKLKGLALKEHVLRQEAITSELFDVVTGAEAILGPPR